MTKLDRLARSLPDARATADELFGITRSTVYPAVRRAGGRAPAFFEAA